MTGLLLSLGCALLGLMTVFAVFSHPPPRLCRREVFEEGLVAEAVLRAGHERPQPSRQLLRQRAPCAGPELGATLEEGAHRPGLLLADARDVPVRIALRADPRRAGARDDALQLRVAYHQCA